MTSLTRLVPVPGSPGFRVDWAGVEEALRGLVSVEALTVTAQDPRFHAEGDVWLHTRLVVEALVSDGGWRALGEGDRAVSFVAALAHDVGKVSTTRVDADGRLTARGHSRRGEQLVRRWLWELGASFAERELVCRLIRNHQVPFHAFEREDPPSLVARLSLGLRNDLLFLLALADARGRRCAEPVTGAGLVEQCELYRELCREEGVFEAPRAFATEHTRVVWREANGRRSPDVPVFDDTTCEITVMSGLPASGKNYWLETQCPGLEVVSLDALRELHEVDPAGDQGRIVREAREAARRQLREGRPFAWNATNLSEDLRAQVIELARAYKARVHLVYCEAGPGQLAARNGARPRPVPASAMRRMLQRWSVPWPDEAHRVTYAVSLHH